MSDSDNNPDYRWRPATKGDIGSIARFCDHPSPHEDWWYGILVDIEADSFDGDIYWSYHCQHGGDMDKEVEEFLVCEVQYDANKEP